jgi:diacylglycerol kinase family enzyme
MSGSAETVAVVHPLRVDGGIGAATEQLAEWAHQAGVAAPHVVPTTAHDTGEKQARDAVAAGADLVLSWGGDGTLGAVASALVDTDVPLGIIPAGTGNLLARNLGIPLDLAAAAQVAFTGIDRRIDVVDVGLGGHVVTSTVIAGMGLDADLIDAPEELKKAIGPAAYFANAVKLARTESMRVGVAVDGGQPRWFKARSVLIANVGGLVAGLDVAPEADLTDGLLRVVVLPLDRPADWVKTGARLVSRRPISDSSRIVLTGKSVWVVTHFPQRRQVDGDVMEDGRTLQARVRPAALLVRAPQA